LGPGGNGRRQAAPPTPAQRARRGRSRTRDERGAVQRLELVKAAAVDDARDDGADVEALARVDGHAAGELFGRERGLVHGGHGREARRGGRRRRRRRRIQVGDNAPRNGQRVRVIGREVVRDARRAAVHVGAAEVFRGHDLARGRLDERRAAEKNGARARHDDRLVRHGGHVRAARRARAHDHGDLRNARRRHARLVEENAPKVVAVGKHFVLRAAGGKITEINSREGTARGKKGE
jgi:hypothetical protein